MSAAEVLLPGFVARTIDTPDASLHVRIAGSGPPVALLHGYPETLLAWHRVAPRLAEHFTVVLPDLRGYGRSSCPPSDVAHRAYSKRAMARDVAIVMDQLGFRQFAIVGHDRGGRVAYRLALDWPERVARLAVVDILTTADQLEPLQAGARSRLRHWALLAQPAPIPETLIRQNPAHWLESRFRQGTLARSTADIDPAAIEDYRIMLADPDHIHATCEDFRAGAGCDLEDDTADRRNGHRIECPTLLVWGTHGSLTGIEDPVAIWAPWCRSVMGRSVASGHYVPEENPGALIEATLPFLAASEGMP